MMFSEMTPNKGCLGRDFLDSWYGSLLAIIFVINEFIEPREIDIEYFRFLCCERYLILWCYSSALEKEVFRLAKRGAKNVGNKTLNVKTTLLIY